MKRGALAIALLLAAGLPTTAASQPPAGDHASGGAAAPPRTTHAAQIGFDSMRPRRMDIVAGESVRWVNESARTHTVTADDQSFDSGRLGSSQTYTRRFVAAGEVPYHCTLHPTMRGVVGVHHLLLDAPGQAAAPGRAFPLTGRSALAPGTPLSIEADSGSGFRAVASSTIGGDGRFAARIAPAASVRLRAVAGAATSSVVDLLVLDRRVTVKARSLKHGRLRLHVNVAPPSRGGRVVLQLFLPERFGWWPVRTATLGRSSAAMFTLRPTRRLRARVRYTLADGATALATSRTFRVGPARTPRRRHG